MKLFAWLITLFLLIGMSTASLAINPEKTSVVSNVVIDGKIYFGGDKGQIVTYESLDAVDQWQLSRLAEGSLVTSLAMSPLRKTNTYPKSLAGRNRTPTTTGVFFATTATGRIYKNTLGVESDNWVPVFGAETWAKTQDKSLDPLFDIAVIKPRHLLAVGAFGLVLESINNGETWRSIGSDLDNPDGGHFYKIVVTSRAQQNEYGVFAAIIGEFGQVFILKKSKKPTSWQWEKLDFSAEVTFFDGHYLSKRWLVLAGVGGAVLGIDLGTQETYLTKACKTVSLFSVAADKTGRNLVIAGDQGSLVRLSLLDAGESAPPSLTCQFYDTDYSSITGISIDADRLLISTDKGIFVKSAVGLVPMFSEPRDLQW